jgi:HD superfamily phosphohydrolase
MRLAMPSDTPQPNVLHDYASVNRSDTKPKDLLRILRRYVFSWAAPSALSTAEDRLGNLPTVRQFVDQPVTSEPVIQYRGLVQGDEASPILQSVRKLAALPFFYRLNSIRQLSTTNLSINLDGTHNRLAHSLGTLDIASRFLCTLRHQAGLDLSDIDAKAVLVYAFIHDCFHGPMGHSLDLLKDVLWGPRTEERVDKHLLLMHIDEGLKGEADRRGFLWSAVLKHVAKDEKECKAIMELLQAFLTVPDRDKNFLSEIVDGDLDSDRLDYIWRDHAHLMMSGFEQAAYAEALVGSIAAVKYPRGEVHLCFHKDHSRVVEAFLDHRVDLYTNFYEHPVKTVLDEMLVHAVYYLLRDENVLGAKDVLAEFARSFSTLTDESLQHFLTEVTSQPRHAVAFALANDFRSNRPFSVLYKGGLRRENFRSLTHRAGLLQNAFKKIIEDETEYIRSFVRERPLGLEALPLHHRIIHKFNQAISEPVVVPNDDPDEEMRGCSLPYTPEEDIYRIQMVCGGSFAKKMYLEQLLWSELLTRQTAEGIGFKDALVPLAAELARPYGGGDGLRGTILASLLTTPLVFISLSWIPGVTEDDLLSHKRGYRATGARFHDRGQPSAERPQLKVKSRDEDYFLIVSAPPILLRAGGMKLLVSETFQKLLFDRQWADPYSLQEPPSRWSW